MWSETTWQYSCSFNLIYLLFCKVIHLWYNIFWIKFQFTYLFRTYGFEGSYGIYTFIFNFDLCYRNLQKNIWISVKAIKNRAWIYSFAICLFYTRKKNWMFISTKYYILCLLEGWLIQNNSLSYSKNYNTLCVMTLFFWKYCSRQIFDSDDNTRNTIWKG